MNPQTLSLLLTGVSALGALGAAVAAAASARATRRAAEAQLFATHYAEYGTSEMLRALRVLRAWRSDMGDEFEIKWKRALDSKDERAHEVGQARRHVKFYFMKALRLYEAGYVSQKFLTELAGVDGINILYDIVEPLEFALNARFDDSKFKLLKNLCGRAGTGRLIEPIPPAPRKASGG